MDLLLLEAASSDFTSLEYVLMAAITTLAVGAIPVLFRVSHKSQLRVTEVEVTAGQRMEAALRQHEEIVSRLRDAHKAEITAISAVYNDQLQDMLGKFSSRTAQTSEILRGFSSTQGDMLRHVGDLASAGQNSKEALELARILQKEYRSQIDRLQSAAEDLAGVPEMIREHLERLKAEVAEDLRREVAELSRRFPAND